jgi:hypothetical protein
MMEHAFGRLAPIGLFDTGAAPVSLDPVRHAMQQ